jgi:hypothetical protein
VFLFYENFLLIKKMATKLDNNKLRMDLIPPVAIEELAKIFTFGASKYNDRNWEKGLKYSRLLAALDRHLLEFKKCNDFDEESKELHISHAFTNLAMLIHLYTYNKECDDRINYEKKN